MSNPLKPDDFQDNPMGHPDLHGHCYVCEQVFPWGELAERTVAETGQRVRLCGGCLGRIAADPALAALVFDPAACTAPRDRCEGCGHEHAWEDLQPLRLAVGRVGRACPDCRPAMLADGRATPTRFVQDTGSKP